MLDGYGETGFFLHPTFIQHSSNISSNMLDEMLDRFTSAFTFTELRPDIVIYSNSIKRVVLIELTSPCEENMPYWHDYKVQHYANLTRSIRTNGWQCEVLAIEVGARGFCSRTVVSALKRLGFLQIRQLGS